MRLFLLPLLASAFLAHACNSSSGTQAQADKSKGSAQSRAESDAEKGEPSRKDVDKAVNTVKSDKCGSTSRAVKPGEVSLKTNLGLTVRCVDLPSSVSELHMYLSAGAASDSLEIQTSTATPKTFRTNKKGEDTKKTDGTGHYIFDSIVNARLTINNRQYREPTESTSKLIAGSTSGTMTILRKPERKGPGVMEFEFAFKVQGTGMPENAYVNGHVTLETMNGVLKDAN